MKRKIINRILISVGTAIALTLVSGNTVEARTNSKTAVQENKATQLAGVTGRNSANWNWALGEGTEQGEEGYRLGQTNSFFGSVNATPNLRPDELFNRNNNIGDPLPDYGDVEIFRF